MSDEPAAAAAPPSVSSGDTSRHYVVSPAWDLAFVINAPWILVAALFFLFREGVSSASTACSSTGW